MEIVAIRTENFNELMNLQAAYKEVIHFYGCICDNRLVACCSVCVTYSTFQ